MPKYKYKIIFRGEIEGRNYTVIQRYTRKFLLWRKDAGATYWHRFAENDWRTYDGSSRAVDVYLGLDTYGYHLYLDEYLEGDLQLNLSKVKRCPPLDPLWARSRTHYKCECDSTEE
jgi:hypothetical protein